MLLAILKPMPARLHQNWPHAGRRQRAAVWFDVEGLALVPDGPEMRERPTIVMLHDRERVELKREPW